MLNKIIVFLISIVLAVNVYAATDPISTTLVDKAVFSITGTGFGNHTDNNEGSFTWQGESPLCAKFKDFEDNNLTSGGWSIVAGDPNNDWSVTSTSTRSNSVYQAHRVCNDGAFRQGALQYTMGNYNVAEEGYISFYVKISETPVGGGGKIWRIYGDVGNIYVGIDDEDRDVEGHSTMYGGAGQTSSTSTYGVDTWDRMEIYFKATGTDVFTVWLNGVEQWSRDDWFTSALGGNGHTLDIGHMIEQHVGEYYEFDDIFVNYTRSRVEIGNASTWSSCTLKEIQVPTAWNDTGITFVVNQGALPDDEPAYLYTVAADGTVSAGTVVYFNETTTSPALTLQADFSTSSATTSFTFTGASVAGATVSSVVSNNGTATITSGAGTDSVSGTVSGVSLTSGVNMVQVTLTDSVGGTDVKTINITYTPTVPTYTAKVKRCTLKNVTLK